MLVNQNWSTIGKSKVLIDARDYNVCFQMNLEVASQSECRIEVIDGSTRLVGDQ